MNSFLPSFWASNATTCASKIEEDKTATTIKSTIPSKTGAEDSFVKEGDNRNHPEDDDIRGAERDKSQTSSQQRCPCTFNIFDGTAPANSRYSEFIFDGDDEDEENDLESSEYWSECQNA